MRSSTSSANSIGSKSIKRTTTKKTIITHSTSPDRVILSSNHIRPSAYRPTDIRVLEDRATRTLVNTSVIYHEPRVIYSGKLRTSKSSQHAKQKLRFWNEEVKNTGLQVIKEAESEIYQPRS